MECRKVSLDFKVIQISQRSLRFLHRYIHGPAKQHVLARLQELSCYPGQEQFQIISEVQWLRTRGK